VDVATATHRARSRQERRGRADKFADIGAGVVLAGEASRSARLTRGDWASSRDPFRRNPK